jgi:hypothetical protein
MDFSQVLTAVTGWVAFSVPVSLLIGAFLALGSKAPQEIPVRSR